MSDPQIRKVGELVERLRKGVAAASFDGAECGRVLAAIKIELLQFQLLPPFDEDKNVTRAQLTLARDALEQAVLLSCKLKDPAMFERHVVQLKPYYTDFASLMAPSQLQWAVLGLNLMHLLVSNRSSDFHAELELIPAAQQEESKFVTFPVHLEEELMEGSYNKVLTASKELPIPEYAFFMSTLVDSVRDRIAACAEVAYQALPAADAYALLLLKPDAQGQAYLAKRNWEVRGSTVVFPKQAGQRAPEVAAQALVAQALGYAVDMERII